MIKAIQKEEQTSLRQTAVALNKRGIKAPRGGSWSAVQIQRVLAQV